VAGAAVFNQETSPMQGIDLAVFDTKTEADKGFKLDILDIRTGEPSGFWIQILGVDSEVMQQRIRDEADLIADAMKRDLRTSETPEGSRSRRIERLVLATINWSENAKILGESFPFSRENARKLYSDPRFPTIREQVERGIQNRLNFLLAPASSS
jgi:hypothetical protein